MSKRILAIVLACFLSCSPAWADLQYELQALTEYLLAEGEGQLPAGGRIHQPAIVEAFYAELGYQPVWKDRDQAARVLGILKASFEEGLEPDDYHYSQLMTLWSDRDALMQDYDRRRARFDVLLTDGILLYIRHLLQGKVDTRTLDPSYNYSRIDFEPRDVSARLRTAIADNRIPEVVEQVRPPQPFYHQMKSALAYYRELDQSRTFRPIPDNVVLKPGQSHSNIPLLQQRLRDLGYQVTEDNNQTHYGPSLESAVRQFQADHGIDVDGIIGRQSYTFLNMSYSARVDSLRINMDRVRWISQSVSDDYIVVNIAGFELYYHRDHELQWETPVMTGTIQHQTPIFTAKLKYLEFNPIWTVPRSIIGRSLLPKFKANPQYVYDNNYHLYNRQGKQVDPMSIDWASASIRNFPYSVVQQPGDKNALGRVKFIFPNRHAVYLHDTPSRELFSRSARAFSSGCVRVKQPLEFASVLLNDPQRWSVDQVRDLVASRKPQERVYLDRDVDVMLMYWTTSPTRGGRLQFHADVYGKDPAALAALNAAPRVN